MRREKLIKFYEERLKKVKIMWSNNTTELNKDRNKEYIDFAEKELEEVKNGREW